MALANYLRVPKQNTMTSTGILLIRVIVGLAFMHHGWGKIQNPMGWMGAQSDMPGILQAAAAVAEFGGGIAWVLGLFTLVFSFLIFCTMAVALRMHILIKGDPFVGHPSSYELALVYWGVASFLLLSGAGKFSADRFIFGQK